MGILNTAAGSRNKDRKRKPDELLSSVVRETAVPAAVELLRNNKEFVFPSGTAWVMLVLSADAIGGLSKRHGRDEAKGSIIELIDSDQIQTVATADMLGEESFGIIPTADTLERMDEYSLLTQAEYAWAVVWQKPTGELIVDLVADATFAQAKAVSKGATELREVVGDRAWLEHSGLDPDAVGDDTVAIETVGDEDQGEDEDPIFDPIDDDGEPPAFDEGQPIFEDVAEEEPAFDADEGQPVYDEVPVAVEADPIPAFDEVDTQDPDSHEEAVQPVLLADQAEAKDVIARRFLSDELDLDVRLDEFNTSFAIGAPVVQIAIPEGSTEWLGDQIAHLNRQANADLAQLRWAHEDELRTLYVNLMSAHAEQVIREVGMEREGSPYRELKAAADAEHAERLSQKEEKTRTRKTEIVADYEAQAKKLAEQAAIQAEIQYKERNRAKMEREQIDAIAQIDREIENDHTFKQQEILRLRRAHATLKMQTGQTRIFEVLAERQSDFLTREQQALDTWKQEIQQLIDDNRKADIAQADTLAEHYRVTDELGIQRREQEALLESVRTEHADRIRRMEDELERNRKDAVVAMQSRDAEWKHNLDLEKEKTDSQAQRVTDLLLRLETVEQSVGRRYENQIADLVAARDSYSTELARASELQSRYNKMLIALIVALPMLGGLAGYIGGAAM
jgi:hypothetical protein